MQPASAKPLSVRCVALHLTVTVTSFVLQTLYSAHRVCIYSIGTKHLMGCLHILYIYIFYLFRTFIDYFIRNRAALGNYIHISTFLSIEV